MPNLGKMLAIAGMMAALGETQYGGHGVSARNKESEPEWKRKQCKSCIEYHSSFKISYCKCRRGSDRACSHYEKYSKK